MTEARIINLPKISDVRGNLSFMEEENHIPFSIKRTFWIYDVPGGVERGGHAYRQTHELIVALSGSFDVVLNDGYDEKIFHLSRSYYGLYVPKMIWRKMQNFSTNSLAIVVASTHFDASDYIYDFEQYKIELGYE